MNTKTICIVYNLILFALIAFIIPSDLMTLLCVYWIIWNIQLCTVVVWEIGRNESTKSD